MGGHPASLNLIFDTLIFGQAARSPLARGGIYRYASQLLQALHDQANITLKTYCPEPLLASLAEVELKRLDLGANPLALALTTSVLTRSLPPLLIRLAKPLRRSYARLPGARAASQQRFDTLLKSCDKELTLFHTPFQAVPSAIRRHDALPVVVTVHDMIPMIMPELFTRETVRHFHGLVDGLCRSDQVICVSESTKRDFLHFTHTVPAEHVHVTPLAASPELQPVTDPHLLSCARERFGLKPNDRVILSLCTLEPRKNLATLLTAFETLQRHSSLDSIKLLLAGSVGWKSAPLLDRLRESSASSNILLLGHVTEEELPVLYSLAEVFVYPSLYEGFGLPPLEAMSCGTPVIVGNTSSIPEVTGEAGLTIDPQSPVELTTALERVLASESLRRQLAQQCEVQAKKFSWARTAHLTRGVYDIALASRR